MIDHSEALVPESVEAHPLLQQRAHWKDIAVSSLLWSIALGTVAILLWIVSEMAYKGASAVLSVSYWTTLPANAGREGGILSLLVSTVWVLGLSLVLCVPLGVLCAYWLSTSRPSFLADLVRRSLGVMASLPSLIVGLFGLAFFHDLLGVRVSLLLGGLTAGVMVLPIFIRGVEEGFRQVPSSLTAGAAALGVGQWTTLCKILLPSAMPAIGASLALAMGRVLGESAALLLTAGPSLRMPDSMNEQGRVLAYHIYMMASEIPGGEPRAYAAAFALVLLVLFVNLGAGFLAERVNATH
jgi:phosphate transport system permease protein